MNEKRNLGGDLLRLFHTCAYYIFSVYAGVVGDRLYSLDFEYTSFIVLLMGVACLYKALRHDGVLKNKIINHNVIVEVDRE